MNYLHLRKFVSEPNSKEAHLLTKLIDVLTTRTQLVSAVRPLLDTVTMQARSAAGVGTLEPVRRNRGVAEQAQREREGGRMENGRCWEQYNTKLVPRPVSYSAVEVKNWVRNLWIFLGDSLSCSYMCSVYLSPFQTWRFSTLKFCS